MNSYKVLNKQVFSDGNYTIVPIRMQDKYNIMKWRNDQMYHLRQIEPLVEKDQIIYFNNIVSKLFNQEKPQQVLFSYLENNKCLGYGGLVHINWIDRNAEISFIMDTELEADNFEFHWSTYLGLIEKVAFLELGLHKIFTYAYDLRPRLFEVLQQAGYKEEARLNEHCYFDNKFIDVLIHSKIKKSSLALRPANLMDVDVTYTWANDPFVRQFSYNRMKINYDDHKDWFATKISSENCIYFIMEFNGEPAGSIRFDLEESFTTAKISYLLDPKFKGKGLGTKLLQIGVEGLIKLHPELQKVWGLVLKTNLPSIRIFQKLGYQVTGETETEYNFERKLL